MTGTISIIFDYDPEHALAENPDAFREFMDDQPNVAPTLDQMANQLYGYLINEIDNDDEWFPGVRLRSYVAIGAGTGIELPVKPKKIVIGFTIPGPDELMPDVIAESLEE